MSNFSIMSHKPVPLPPGIWREKGWLTDGEYVFLDIDTAREVVARKAQRSNKKPVTDRKEART
jgi:hypothetical protein